MRQPIFTKVMLKAVAIDAPMAPETDTKDVVNTMLIMKPAAAIMLYVLSFPIIIRAVAHGPEIADIR